MGGVSSGWTNRVTRAKRPHPDSSDNSEKKKSKNTAVHRSKRVVPFIPQQEHNARDKKKLSESTHDVMNVLGIPPNGAFPNNPQCQIQLNPSPKGNDRGAQSLGRMLEIVTGHRFCFSANH